MRIAISAESTIDLPKEQLERFDIHTLPFTLILGDESVLDGEIKPEKLFEFTEKTGVLPKTSAVNEFQCREHFKSLKDMGYDAIIHFALSSGISSACSNAMRVKDEFKDVYVVDTKSLSTGIALLAIQARKLADKGLSPKEIYEISESRVKDVQASFSLESVNYLYKGGRCSMLSMLGANLLHIKPEIYVHTDTGTMSAGKKFRGPMKKVVLSYVDDTLEQFNNPDLSLVFITYSTAPDDVVEAVKDRLSKRGFKEIIPTHAGGTISCHCGPHCLGILYINDGKTE